MLILGFEGQKVLAFVLSIFKKFKQLLFTVGKQSLVVTTL